jgi:hypothetical protein
LFASPLVHKPRRCIEFKLSQWICNSPNQAACFHANGGEPFAPCDPALGLSNGYWSNGDEFDARTCEECGAVEAGLERPFVLVLIVAEKAALAFTSAHLEVRAVGRAPLVFDGFDVVGCVVQLESERALVGAIARICTREQATLSDIELDYCSSGNFPDTALNRAVTPSHTWCRDREARTTPVSHLV